MNVSKAFVSALVKATEALSVESLLPLGAAWWSWPKANRPYIDWPTVLDAGEFAYRTRVKTWTLLSAAGYKLTLAGIRCRKRTHEAFL
jgi:hypothetical protein